MNRRMVAYIISRIAVIEAGLFIFPLIVSLIHRETKSVAAFLISIAVAMAFGLLMSVIFKPKSKVISAKDGFVLVALCWLTLSLIGAVPFTISGAIPNYVDAFFETVSGFTTTGASILGAQGITPAVETLGFGMLFWRSFTHWIGGMGILVFVMAIIPSVTDRSIHILRAEVPGPIKGKLVPKITDTAKILYIIYIVITLLEAILLLCGGFTVFESLVYAFGTAGTGGFALTGAGLSNASPYIQIVITVFMLLFGVNFNLYFLAIMGKIKSLFKSRELWCFLAIFLISSGIMTVNLVQQNSLQLSEALRLSTFQSASIVTTTGYGTADFAKWPMLSQSIIFILLFCGGCAGSTAGGLKVSRIMILVKTLRRELNKMLHPRAVKNVKFEGKEVDEATIKSTSSYFVLYMLLIIATFLLLSFDKFDFVTNLSASVSCFNNVGPGLSIVGPMGTYGGFSVLSKIVLSLAMLFGRLEIYPILFILTPSTWSKRHF
ncbi:MAG: TrkH family potassium uptake protein [Oscillospiraceae bacterium]|nr:TrkH family potassium uptake protein [Candidatus Equicaccousia limihippi]